jgi:hypothetical protein
LIGLPFLRAAAVASLTPIGILAAVRVRAPVRIPVDVLVNINIHVATSPIAIVGEHSAPGHADAERNQRRVRVINVGRRRVINRRRISWHIDDLRISGLDLNDLFGDLRDLTDVGLHHDNICDGHNLLLSGLECAGLLCLPAEVLDRVHQFFGLVEKRFA